MDKSTMQLDYSPKYLPPLLHNDEYTNTFNLRVGKITMKTHRTHPTFLTVKWWGEQSPSYLSLPSGNIVYRIAEKTLAVYLKFSEVVEFSIMTSQSLIGSSFLHKPEQILEQSDITMPIVDHSGCPIGELTLQFEGDIFSKNCVLVEKNCPSQKPKRPSSAVGKRIFKTSVEKNAPRYGIAVSLASLKVKNRKPKEEEVVSANSINSRPQSKTAVKVMIDEQIVPEKVRTESENLSKTKVLPVVLDYLLGKELSTYNEKCALTFLKMLSPSQNFVTTITNSCQAL